MAHAVDPIGCQSQRGRINVHDLREELSYAHSECGHRVTGVTCLCNESASSPSVGGRSGLLRSAAIAVALLLLWGCTPGKSAQPPHARQQTQTIVAAATTEPPIGPNSSAAPATEAADSASAPINYRSACASEGAVCVTNHLAGSVPAALMRPLEFPLLKVGQACPASHGSELDGDGFGGIALGAGPVRPIIAGEPVGDAVNGIADLINPTSVPPWLGVKTLWASVPAYQGPVVIRAKRLDAPGVIAMGEAPTVTTLVVPPGPTLNGGSGWRTAPGGTWVMAPGCYAWQVDGLTFSYVIVFRAVLQ